MEGRRGNKRVRVQQQGQGAAEAAVTLRQGAACRTAGSTRQPSGQDANSDRELPALSLRSRVTFSTRFQPSSSSSISRLAPGGTSLPRPSSPNPSADSTTVGEHLATPVRTGRSQQERKVRRNCSRCALAHRTGRKPTDGLAALAPVAPASPPSPPSPPRALPALKQPLTLGLDHKLDLLILLHLGSSCRSGQQAGRQVWKNCHRAAPPTAAAYPKARKWCARKAASLPAPPVAMARQKGEPAARLNSSPSSGVV